MPHKLNLYPGTVLESLAAAGRAARAIPPAWPLSATVAVNPLLGQATEPLPVAAARLARVAGARLTMPRAWYAARIAAGEIGADDIAAALDTAPAGDGGARPRDVAEVMAALDTESPAPEALPTLAHLAAEADGTDWPGIVADRIGAWAGGFFDAGQALWSAPVARGAYAEWRAAAQHDLVPEILGLRGFATHVAEAPETAQDAIARAVTRLDLAPEMQESVFHRLLMDLGGWAQLARQRLWQADLENRHEPVVSEFLAIRLVWEEALLAAHEAAIGARWQAVRAAHAGPSHPTRAQVIDAVLQTAAEHAAQRRLAACLAAPRPAGAAPTGAERPALQAAFCIDVRSEPFRRALEACAPGIRTLGFAGFFGLAVAHRGMASDVVEARLPALLLAGQGSRAPLAAEADRLARARARASRAWGRFKLAAVSSFAFVEAAGPLYAGRLLRDALGLRAPEDAAAPAPVLDPLPPLDERVSAAAQVLRAMGLTRGFARLVLLVGHGAGVVNNPHASALHCGACGGHSGEVNARLLAGLLNDARVRAGLLADGIEIPGDTLFVAALHDTTADDVTLFAADQPAPDHRAEIAQARRWLAMAGAAARAERALRLPGARDAADVARRGRDWAQTRHEWGLAGCQAFIAAPRAVTHGRDLSGRAFLHDYDWRQDAGFGVLELILTAPVVVASWIGLQYYGSVVAPDTFGAGDKTLHNVVGGVGVIEGSGGRLRVGLPWQSVHDGTQLMHEPLRLSVCLAAPPEAITQVLERHAAVRALFDNGWLHLLALDDDGLFAWRYRPGGGWLRETSVAGPTARAAA